MAALYPVSAATGSRATVERRASYVRDWYRHGRPRAVVFLDPTLGPDCELVRQMREVGIDVAVRADALRALLDVGAHQPDALVLSAQTPVGDAVRIVTILRAEYALPILLAMEAGEVEFAAPVIAAGAQPMLERPYRIESVLAALRELPTRRQETGAVDVGGLRPDPASLEGWFNGRRLELAPREFAVLLCLAQRAEEVMTSGELLRAVWPGKAASAATLSTTVARLRQRLAGVGAGEAIRTIRRVGYRLEARALMTSP